MTTELRPDTVSGEPAPADVTAPYVPPSARRTRRRRRPSGAPPPLPRQIGWTGKGWLVALAALVVWLVVTALSEWARRVTDQVDAAILRGFARLRTEWLSDVMRAVDRAATGWVMFGLAAVLVVLMVVFRRWRHLFTFLGSVIVLEVIGLTHDRRRTRGRGRTT